MRTRTARPHADHLRRGRASIRNQIYLVTTATVDRTPFFRTLEPGRIVVNALRRESCHAQSLAFVVMPDHLHWLMQLLTDRDLSRCVNCMKSFSARRINAYLGRSGSVWQRGFHDHAVRREEDLAAIARYIVLNPVRAGLVRSVREYSLWDAMWVGGDTHS